MRDEPAAAETRSSGLEWEHPIVRDWFVWRFGFRELVARESIVPGERVPAVTGRVVHVSEREAHAGREGHEEGHRGRARA